MHSSPLSRTRREPQRLPRPQRLCAGLSRLLVGSLIDNRGAAAALAITLASSSAWAQFGPGGGMRPMGGGQGGMGGMGPGPSQPSDKPEGPAEEAPDKTQGDPALAALPSYNTEKRIQFFQLGGYLRGRGFLWNNLHLGQFNGATTNDGNTKVLTNPFTPPYTEVPYGTTTLPSGCTARAIGETCRSNSIKTADIRFRLEPILNLSDYVRVLAQIDIFDNLVLGSTPDGFFINGRGGSADSYPSIYSRGQASPDSGINAVSSSIRAKRAWGEIKSPLLELSIGRMPFHWGMGMLVNDGNCADCDFGVTTDRVMGTIRRWDHFLSFAYDWVATGPTSQLVYNQEALGWHYNADAVDDVAQYTVMLGRADSEADIKDRVGRGLASFNYGALVMVRTQDYDLRYNPRVVQAARTGATGTADSTVLTPAKEVVESLERRSAWSLSTDLWARLLWKKLELEMEGTAVFGKLGNLRVTANQDATVQIQQFGGVIRGRYRLLKDDALQLSAEVGSASGPTNGDANGAVNYRQVSEAPVGPSVSNQLQLHNTRFTFDPDYHVDMLLFRRILGAVHNATYLKPSVTYWLIDSFGGQADVIYSLANKPAATPGHAINMGVELNARLIYRNPKEGFSAMLEYGVLFNLGALEPTAAIWGTAFQPVGSTTAQAFQAKVMFKF